MAGPSTASAMALMTTIRPSSLGRRSLALIAARRCNSNRTGPQPSITYASRLYMPQAPASDPKGKGKATSPDVSSSTPAHPIPGSAEEALHQLTLGGYIRQSSSGVYTFLGPGLHLLRSISSIIDQEMQGIGAQRIDMPTLLPQAGWRKSGRLEAMGSELYRLKDRRGGEWLLAPTHEEEVTRLISCDIQTYKHLPVKVYQITRKHRDEPRPRLGLLRTREFVMKDLYTFDEDTPSALVSYEAVQTAYGRVMQRLFGSQVEGGWRVAEADSGAMGGSRSHEYHVEDEAGEDVIVACSSCGYAANVEVAEAAAANAGTPGQPSSSRQPPAVWQDLDVHLYTNAEPGHTLEEAALTAVVMPRDFKGLDSDKFVANMKRVYPSSSRSSGASWQPWDWRERPEGPILGRFQHLNVVAERSCVGVEGEDVEEAIRRALVLASDQRTAAADTTNGLELSNVEPSSPELRDFFPAGPSGWEYIDLPQATQTGSGSTSCPSCSAGTLTKRKAIEVGHTFVLGDRYTRALGYQFAARPSSSGRQERHFAQMGCYGLGVTRLVGVLAIRARQAWLKTLQADGEKAKPGLLWPEWLAPYTHAIVLAEEDARACSEVEKLIAELDGPDSPDTRLLVDDRHAVGVGARLKEMDALGVGSVWVVRRNKRPREGEVEWSVARQR